MGTGPAPPAPMGIGSTLIGCALASSLAMVGGCGPSPYSEGQPVNEPVDSRPGSTSPGGGSGGKGSSGTASSSSGGTTGGGTTTGGTTTGGSSSGGSSSGSTGTLPVGDAVIIDTFEGTGAFKAIEGTLTVVPRGAGQAGRLCANAAGLGHIEASIGPVAAGTYQLTANVQQDLAAPGRTWTVEATSWAPGPDIQKAQGDLAPTVKLVTSTVIVPSGGAFAATFAVKVGSATGTCMLVDDIRVTKLKK